MRNKLHFCSRRRHLLMPLFFSLEMGVFSSTIRGMFPSSLFSEREKTRPVPSSNKTTPSQPIANAYSCCWSSNLDFDLPAPIHSHWTTNAERLTCITLFTRSVTALIQAPVKDLSVPAVTCLRQSGLLNHRLVPFN